MSYDAWAARLTVTLAAIAALWATARGVYRVLRSTYRVHAMLLGVGVPGDPDYRPGMDARMDRLEDDATSLREELAAARVEVASTHRVAVEAIIGDDATR